MKTRFRDSCCLIAALVLAAALTPLGTRLGEAQGRRSESLQVAIPTGGFDLTGFCNQSQPCLFMDEGLRGLVQAELSTTTGKVPSYVFRLLLDPGLEGSGVRLDGAVFGQPTLKSPYCEFGNTDFGNEAPDCLEGFLTQAPGFPTSEYRFELQVATTNLEQGTGTLYLYFDAYPQTEERHSVVCKSSQEVIIVQAGATSWTTTGPVSLTCREYVYVPTPGKKSPPKYYFDYRMTATTRDFNFQIDWTK